MKRAIVILFIVVFSINFLANAQNKNKIITCSCNTDADGDGISGCFDKCPNTDPRAKVDSHGCPLDTDGDGVVDYLDKQLITPTESQPSDIDGIGNCECPCYNKFPIKFCGNNIGKTFVHFMPNSISLNNEMKSVLEKYANKMKLNPNFKVSVNGYDNGFTSYKGQQLAWDHAYTVINYFVKILGIDYERFVFVYGMPLNNNLVEISDNENLEGSHIAPPPFPNLSKIKK